MTIEPAEGGSDGLGQRLRRFGTSAVEQLARMPSALWPSGGGGGGQLLIVPQDLQTSDPSFITEINSGQLGLAGATARIDGKSPFDVRPPSQAWHDSLHSFDWLRHLRPVQHELAPNLARRWVLEWVSRHGRPAAATWSATITGRRVISWLVNAGLVLEGATPREYEAVLGSLARQVRHLGRTYAGLPDGIDRLRALSAMIYSGLCMAEQEHLLNERLPIFLSTLDRQVLKDGGHVGRNPAVLVDLLLDLLPLKQCFVARDRAPPAALLAAIRRIIPMLRYLRLGDGSLARFNGMGATMPDGLGAALAFDDGRVEEIDQAPQSRYCRLQRRRTVIVADAGTPPATELSGSAHAGCLAFELSSGPDLMIVNCGEPGPADRDWRMAARGTVSHSTLVINDTSSGRLIRQRQLEDRIGSPGLAEPNHVEARISDNEDGSIELSASHDGYLERYDLVHARMLRITAQGDRVEGIDRVFNPARLPMRARGNLPFSIHFHLHPRVVVMRSGGPQTAILELPSGERWRLQAQGAKLGMEESLYFAHISGPLQSVQVVLRGLVAETTEVRWRLERIAPAAV